MSLAAMALALTLFSAQARPDQEISLAVQNLLAASNVSISGVAGSQAGVSVAAAGDVNGDGIPDIAVGAPLLSVKGRLDAGGVFVVFGGASPRFVSLAALAPRDGFRILGAAAGDMTGYSVASAGDLNGDGFGDLLIGAPFASRHGRVASGVAYVVYGLTNPAPHQTRHKRGPPTTATIDLAALGDHGVEIEGESTGDEAGFSVAATLPSGTRVDDLIVGAPYRSPNGQHQAGSAYVLRADALSAGTRQPPIDLAALAPGAGFEIDGTASGDLAGYAVAGATDLDGDSLPDLVIGAPGANGSRGAAFVVFNKPGDETLSLNTLLAAAGVRYDGALEGGMAGDAVGVVPAVRAADAPFILVGAPLAANKTGVAYAFPFVGGSSEVALPDTVASGGVVANGDAPGDALGYALSASIVNGTSDSARFALLGAPGASPGNRVSAGEVVGINVDRVPPGPVIADTVPVGQGFTLTGALDGDQAGVSVAGNAVVSLDGRGAVALVGAPHAQLESDPLAGTVTQVPAPPTVVISANSVARTPSSAAAGGMPTSADCNLTNTFGIRTLVMRPLPLKARRETQLLEKSHRLGFKAISNMVYILKSASGSLDGPQSTTPSSTVTVRLKRSPMPVPKTRTTITLLLTRPAWKAALRMLHTNGRVDAHVTVVATDVRPSLQSCYAGGPVTLTAVTSVVLSR